MPSAASSQASYSRASGVFWCSISDTAGEVVFAYRIARRHR